MGHKVNNIADAAHDIITKTLSRPQVPVPWKTFIFLVFWSGEPNKKWSEVALTGPRLVAGGVEGQYPYQTFFCEIWLLHNSKFGEIYQIKKCQIYSSNGTFLPQLSLVKYTNCMCVRYLNWTVVDIWWRTYMSVYAWQKRLS